MEAYRIEDLARESGTTVRTIRAYQDRGLLPKPQRDGRANLYGPVHLSRLRQISDLLERGYTLASIKELLEAWDAGTGLGGVLGLVEEMRQPWTSERPARISRSQLTATFGGRDDNAIAEAVALHVLEPVEDSVSGEEEFLVPSPQELAVAADLHAAGVPSPAIAGHLREVRGDVEHIAERFMEFTIEHVFMRFLDHTPTEDEAIEAADLVRRLRPLAWQTVDAELARAMHTLTARMVERYLGNGNTPAAPFSPPQPVAAETGAGHVSPAPPEASRPASIPPEPAEPPPARPEQAATQTPSEPGTETEDQGGAGGQRRQDGPNVGDPEALSDAEGTIAVALPAPTVEEVEALVGPEGTAAFITAAAEREVRARAMDTLAAASHGDPEPDGDSRVKKKRH